MAVHFTCRSLRFSTTAQSITLNWKLCNVIHGMFSQYAHDVLSRFQSILFVLRRYIGPCRIYLITAGLRNVSYVPFHGISRNVSACVPAYVCLRHVCCFYFIYSIQLYCRRMIVLSYDMLSDEMNETTTLDGVVRHRVWGSNAFQEFLLYTYSRYGLVNLVHVHSRHFFSDLLHSVHTN